MLRVVLDPGVLVAALISPRGAPAQLVLAWRRGAFELIVSPQLVAELHRVLTRPEFRPCVTLDEVDRYVELFRRAGSVRPDPPAPEQLSPDPGDDYLIALARSSAARYLVSGDRHLTGLCEATPPVLRPRELLDRL